MHFMISDVERKPLSKESGLEGDLLVLVRGRPPKHKADEFEEKGDQVGSCLLWVQWVEAQKLQVLFFVSAACSGGASPSVSHLPDPKSSGRSLASQMELQAHS